MKSYVGYTKKTIEKRWSEHVSLAFDDRPHSKFRRFHFQDAIKKYGVEAWTHTVLHDNVDLVTACDLERKEISDHNSQSPYGYNEAKGGLGVVMTEEGKKRHAEATREALSRPDVRARYLEGIRRSHRTPEFLENNRVAQKLAQNRPEVIAKKSEKMKARCSVVGYVPTAAKPVRQLTKDFVVVATFASAVEASRATGTNYTKITEVARGLRKFSGGSRWEYMNVECKEHE